MSCKWKTTQTWVNFSSSSLLSLFYEFSWALIFSLTACKASAVLISPLLSVFTPHFNQRVFLWLTGPFQNTILFVHIGVFKKCYNCVTKFVSLLLCGIFMFLYLNAHQSPAHANFMKSTHANKHWKVLLLL